MAKVNLRRRGRAKRSCLVALHRLLNRLIFHLKLTTKLQSSEVTKLTKFCACHAAVPVRCLGFCPKHLFACFASLSQRLQECGFWFLFPALNYASCFLLFSVIGFPQTLVGPCRARRHCLCSLQRRPRGPGVGR